MLPIQNFYTGQRGGVAEVPELGKTEAAITSMQAQELKRSELAYNQALQSRADLLKAGDIDVVDLIVDANREIQDEKINEFQNYINDVYSKHNGNLPTNVLLDIVKKRRELESFQKNRLGMQQAYLKDEATFRSNPFKYNIDNVEEERAKYYNTGVYTPGSLLKPAPIVLSNKLLEMSKNITQMDTVATTTIDKHGATHTTSVKKFNIDYNTIVSETEDIILGDQQVREQSLTDFQNKLTDQEKQYYIELSEKLDKNPIVLYASDVRKEAMERHNQRIDKYAESKLDEGKLRGNLWYVDHKATATIGELGTAPQFMKNEYGFSVYTGALGNKTVDISRSNIEQIEPGVSINDLPEQLRVVPAFVSNTSVEWKILNKDKRIRVYDTDANGNRIKYKPEEMIGKKRELMQKQGYVIELHTEDGDRFYYAYLAPSEIHIKTPLVGLENSVSLFLGDFKGQLPEVSIKPAVSKPIDFNNLFNK